MVGYAVFPEVGGQLEEAQVALARLVLLEGREPVESVAEHRPWKQLLPVDVPGKGPGLADQGGDDVAIVYPRDLADGARVRGDLLPTVDETHGILAQMSLNEGADQPGRNRIGAGADPSRRITRDADSRLVRLRKADSGEWAKGRPLFGHLGLPQGVGAAADLPKKGLVSRDRGKVPAAAEDELVFDPPLDDALGGLDVAVLVGASDRDRAGLHVEVLAEGGILDVEPTASLAAL